MPDLLVLTLCIFPLACMAVPIVHSLLVRYG